MNFELQKKIKEILEGYREFSKDQTEAFRNIFEPFRKPEILKRYTDEGRKATITDGISDINENWDKCSKLFNQKLTAAIGSTRGHFLSSVRKAQRSNDHATKVSNALQFLQIEGKEITDESASMILKDFIDDYDQMQLFKKVIGKNVELENASGKTTFPMTFGKLNKFESALNTFKELEKAAENMFLGKRDVVDQVTIAGNIYSIPGICDFESSDESSVKSSFQTAESAITGYATIIDEIINTFEN